MQFDPSSFLWMMMRGLDLKFGKLALVAECEEGWLVDQQQAISDDFSGSVFYCPADIFAVDRPYNAAVTLKNPEQGVPSLEKQESRDESKKTTDIKQKRKRKVTPNCNEETDHHQKWRERIVQITEKLVNLGRVKGYFLTDDQTSIQNKGGCYYTAKETVCFASLVKLAKKCGSYAGSPEYVKVDTGVTQIPNLIGKVIENESKTPVVITAFETKILLPPMSKFFLSDIEDLSPLVNDGNKYDVIVIDPPWQNKSVKRSRKYECITLPKIKAIPLPDLASPGALVIVWVTNKTKIMDFVREELFPTWNVNQIGEWHWCKITRNGEFVFDIDSSHKKPYESLIIGRFAKDVANDNQSSQEDSFPFHKVICSVPSILHSRKPSLQNIISNYITPNARCLELFARNLLPGLTSWGNEVLKFQNVVYFERKEEATD